ncbi:MAG: ZIP family metal transporter [Candidatus Helarchaeota archaeon]
MPDILTPIILSMIAGSATVLGGVLGIFKRLSMRQFDTIIGFAAGVMLSVATFGLIDEGLTLLLSLQALQIIGILITLTVIIGGICLGVLSLYLMDKFIPHIHMLAGNEDKKSKKEMDLCERECLCPNKERWFECPYLEDGKCRNLGGCFCPKKAKFQRELKYSGILLAIGLTLHNAPEGIAVGAGFMAISSLGITIAIAISLHNIPEGLAIAIPLMQADYPRKKILLITSISGMAEPLACLFAVLFLQALPSAYLAFFLAFAGGAMIYITSDELIPESHKHGFEHEATLGLVLGFILMLVLMVGFGI